MVMQIVLHHQSRSLNRITTAQTQRIYGLRKRGIFLDTQTSRQAVGILQTQLSRRGQTELIHRPDKGFTRNLRHRHLHHRRREFVTHLLRPRQGHRRTQQGIRPPRLYQRCHLADSLRRINFIRQIYALSQLLKPVDQNSLWLPRLIHIGIRRTMRQHDHMQHHTLCLELFQIFPLIRGQKSHQRLTVLIIFRQSNARPLRM